MLSDKESRARMDQMCLFRESLERPTIDPVICARVVVHGAMNVAPTRVSNEMLEWPADSSRVSLSRITYHPETDTFCGWQVGANVPTWEQR